MSFINYLSPQERAPGITSELILAFQHYFHGGVTIGGTEPEFLAEFKKFKTKYQNEAMQVVLANRKPTDSAMDTAWVQSMMNHFGGNVDELLLILMGMGQLSNAFNLLGGNPPPACVSDVSQEVAARGTSSGKGKVRVTPRYVHVLGQMNAKNKNPQDPGPYGIPEEAKDKVPSPEDMVLSLIEAMEQETEVLDFHDTKPYKDHWRAMKRPDFQELASTLFKHMNDLHKGVDYVEGFRYTDRYQNLISLLQHCKGTIYFMSRPSTYEDVLLNPHMMELRFADNQKNNAKKKVDNRELTARRYQEYFSIHGCAPPPKERVLKGAAKGKKGGKRGTSEITSENEGEASSMAAKPKRRKPNPKKGKAKTAVDDSSAPGTPLSNGEGSSVQGGSVYTTTDSPAFLGVSPLEEESPGNNQQYYIPQQQFAFRGGQYYDAQQQHQSFSHHHKQEYPPQERQPRQIAKAMAQFPQVALLDPTPVAAVSAPRAFIAEYMNIEQQIATTIYDSVHDNPIAAKVTLSTDLVRPLSALSVNTQQQQAQATGHPTNRVNFNNVESENGQVVRAQYKFSQQEPIHQSPVGDWCNQQDSFQQVSTSPVNQQSGYQHTHLLQQHYHSQARELQIPLSSDSGLSLVDPEWYSDGQAELKEIAHVKQVPVAVQRRTTDELLDDYFGGFPEEGAQQQTFTSGTIVNKPMGFSQQSIQKTLPLSKGTEMENAGFGDLADIELDDEDFTGMGWGSQYLLPAPADEDGNQFFDSNVLPLSQSRGQVPSGQIRMVEMERLLSEDP